MNTIGWIGAAVCAGGLVGMGMLIENCRLNYKLKRRDYTLGRKSISPKPVPQERKEWGIIQHKYPWPAEPVTPAEMFERACKNVVEKTPEKFE